jgi:hypothetical protein
MKFTSKNVPFLEDWALDIFSEAFPDGCYGTEEECLRASALPWDVIGDRLLYCPEDFLSECMEIKAQCTSSLNCAYALYTHAQVTARREHAGGFNSPFIWDWPEPVQDAVRRALEGPKKIHDNSCKEAVRNCEENRARAFSKYWRS